MLDFQEFEKDETDDQLPVFSELLIHILLFCSVIKLEFDIREHCVYIYL